MHDYYDGVARNTISDKTFTFVRERKYLGRFSDVCGSENQMECRNFSYSVNCDIIGFCGEIYPYARIIRTSKYYKTEEVNFSYTWEDYRSFVPMDEVKNRYISKYLSYGRSNIKAWLDGGNIGYSYMDRFRARSSVKDDPRLKEVFDKYKIAYFNIGRWDATDATDANDADDADDTNDTNDTNNGANGTNGTDEYGLIAYPVLKDFQFYKVFDAYAGFQKLEHFLTNELVKPDEINIVIPDDMKAQAHGYDKMSFRKEPLGKKRT